MALSCKPLALGLALTLAACAMPETPPTKATGPNGLMAWPDLLGRARPSPSTTISYGSDPLQVVDLWLPQGDGPHPTVIMVHGGCWQTEIADRTIMNWIADDLTRHGVAVWNIDYRGVDRPGGGYPGTFQDVAAAADALRRSCRALKLDLSRLVATGHSAGGHLALWLAARPRLPAGSPLRTPYPIPIHAVVSLGGLPDLEEAARPPGSGCGTEVIARISGGRIWGDLGPPPGSARHPAGADQRHAGPDHPDRLCRRLCPPDARRRRRCPRPDDRPHRPCRTDRPRHRRLARRDGGDIAGASPVSFTLAEARAADAADPLRPFRDRFHLPDGLVYLDGNSLGALPKAAGPRLQQVVEEEWGEELIRSWNSRDWIGAPQRVGAKIAPLIGAKPNEVIVTDSTSVNLFKLLVAAARLVRSQDPAVRERQFPH